LYAQGLPTGGGELQDREQLVLALAAAGSCGVAALVAGADVLAVAAAVNGGRPGARHGPVDMTGVDLLADVGLRDGVEIALGKHGIASK
jgi:hypothetical protein